MFYKLRYGDFASLFYMEISNTDLLKTVSNLLPVFETFIKNRLFVTMCIYLFIDLMFYSLSIFHQYNAALFLKLYYHLKLGVKP